MGTMEQDAAGADRSDVPVLYVVVPCYDEEEVLPETARRLSEKVCALEGAGKVSPQSRVLFVDDGSKDATWHLITGFHDDPANGHLFSGISFAHNRGHQNALYAGLMCALKRGCDAAVSLDADLQDDVDAIDDMVDEYLAGADIVYGVRNNRDTDTGFKRRTAEMFYGLMRWLGAETVSDSADYRLMDARALAALSQYGEVNLFLRGIVPSLGFQTAKVYYRRGARFAGESKYPLSKMVGFAVEGITSFSVKPIRMVTALGGIAVGISVLVLIYALVSMAMGRVVSGWTSLIVSVWLVGGLVMLSLGVVGEYVGRIYLECKHRPRYVVAEELD